MVVVLDDKHWKKGDTFTGRDGVIYKVVTRDRPNPPPADVLYSPVVPVWLRKA